LGVPTPRYLHVPVVRNDKGEKLSKQTGALAVLPGDETAAIDALLDAARFLGLPLERPATISAFWDAAVPAWSAMLAEREARP
jgi:glutamyl-Q tRNA(Asp) synthetase